MRPLGYGVVYPVKKDHSVRLWSFLAQYLKITCFQ